MTTLTVASSREQQFPADELSVGEVAKLAGIAPSAVRFYDRHGVITASRNTGNQRRFTTDAVCRIAVARLAQRVGLTVREIASLFSKLPVDISKDDWARVESELVSEAEQRIAELKELMSLLREGVQICDPAELLGR